MKGHPQDRSISEVRHEAWETRREKYGERGHAGSYVRSGGPPCAHCAAARPMLIKLHVEGILSEGQAAKATGLHRIEVRRLADEYTNRDIEPCLKGRCYSPVACGGFGYCRERNLAASPNPKEDGHG